jgi:polysaccharide biosynthesis transport protein
VGVAFVRERLDERLGNHEQLEEAMGAPVFAVIPKVDAWRNRTEARLVSIFAPDSIAAEAYRTARTSIQYLARNGRLCVLEITGPGQHEGKTTTTVNLAVSLAQSGKSVIAVSCDLRKPRLHRFFDVDNAVGLTSILRGQATLEEAMLPTEIKGLQIITSGPVPNDPAELLGSDRMDQLLAVLRGRADFVLLDTTPALVVADALVLAPKSDGVIVVADAAQTTRAAVSRLRQQFEGVGATIIGGILNNLDPSHAKRYPGYNRYYYSYGRSTSDRPQVRRSEQAQEPPAGDGHRVPEISQAETTEP